MRNMDENEGISEQERWIDTIKQVARERLLNCVCTQKRRREGGRASFLPPLLSLFANVNEEREERAREARREGRKERTQDAIKAFV